MSYQQIICETNGPVGIIRLNRPDALNALTTDMMREVGEALTDFGKDDAIGAIVLTGSEQAFAAGMDAGEMLNKGYVDAFWYGFMAEGWKALTDCRKPLIAAVAGYALGAGCELAMMCDIILAADNARFGQPEVTLGSMPGFGGTQRLTRLIGKSKAMELCLTGRNMDSDEAERAGLVSRIVPTQDLMEDALRTAKRVAGMSAPVVMMIKEAVSVAYESSLSEGQRLEKRLFEATFSLQDQKEGLAAFLEKRLPHFQNY